MGKRSENHVHLVAFRFNNFFCEQFLPREILNGKAPEPGAGSMVEAEGIARYNLDATTGDIQWKPDSRGTCRISGI